MTDLNIKTTEELANYVRERNCDYVKVGVFDVDGVMRGKYMGRDKFLSSLEKGFGFCDVVLGWDSSDQLYDNVDVTGWHTAYPDAGVRLLPETTRLLPFENDLPLVLSEFVGAHGEVCPRGTLRRVLARAADMGYAVYGRRRVRILPVRRDAAFGARKELSRPQDHHAGILRLFDAALDGPLRVLSRAARHLPRHGHGAGEPAHRDRPGVLEAAIKVDNALAAADKAALFKTMTKVLAQRRGWMATFMAKWSRDWPGQSGHIHSR